MSRPAATRERVGASGLVLPDDVIESTATELVVRAERGDEQAIYKALDRADEIAVEQEMRGDLIDAFIYEFPMKASDADDGAPGQLVRGLSAVGIQFCIQRLGRRGLAAIGTGSQVPMFSEVINEESDPCWECMVLATDAMRPGVSSWGIARQPKVIAMRNGRTKPDTFSKAKALAKAQRNACGDLVDEAWKIELIEAIVAGKENGTVKQIRVQSGGGRGRGKGGGGARKQPPARPGRGQATADAPKGTERPASARQQDAMRNIAAENGVDLDSQQGKAILAWSGGWAYVDRIPMSAVDAVFAALRDPDGTQDQVIAEAEQGNDRAVKIRDTYMSRPVDGAR